MLQPAALHQPSPVTAADCPQRQTLALLQPNHSCIRAHNCYPASCSTPPRYAKWFCNAAASGVAFSDRLLRQSTAYNAPHPHDCSQTCQSHHAAALSCSAFAAASSTTQRIGDMPIAPCCCSQLQCGCCRQPRHSAQWQHANRTMLLLSAAARLLPPAATLSALATCHSHHAAALSCSAFAAASRTTQRIGEMPIAPCCCSQLQRVCCLQPHHSAQWRLANRTMLLLSAAARLLPPAAPLSALATCFSL